jgi:hypothetical protein
MQKIYVIFCIMCGRKGNLIQPIFYSKVGSIKYYEKKNCAAEVMFSLVELMLSLCFFLICLLVGLLLGCIPKMSLLSCLEVLVLLEHGFIFLLVWIMLGCIPKISFLPCLDLF